METSKTSPRLHPLVAAAAVAVTLASLVAIAAMTGLLPNSHSSNAPAAPLATAESVEQPVAPTAAKPPAPKPAPQPAPAPVAARPAKAPAPAAAPAAPPVAQAPAVCRSCGHVESIQAIRQEAQPSGLGIAAGAVVGGLLGNQVGGGNGRTLATVAGAVGGGYAGNEVEKRTRATTSYQVRVRMEDGSLRTFNQSTPNGWQIGEPVRVVNGALVARG